MMVSVCLTVRSNVHKLGQGILFGETVKETMSKVFTVCEQPLKSNGARYGTVVKEKVDFPAGM
jgi:hypothetical protein